MDQTSQPTYEDKLCDILFNYSIARDDLKEASLIVPLSNEKDEQTLLYELQILKIISIGVTINYLLEQSSYKDILSEKYWKSIFEFSTSVTKATNDYSDITIDYFNVIKDKLDFYLNELNQNKNAPEPASVIGPAFAVQCGKDDDTHIILSGSKVFKSVVASLKQFFLNEGLIWF